VHSPKPMSSFAALMYIPRCGVRSVAARRWSLSAQLCSPTLSTCHSRRVAAAADAAYDWSLARSVLSLDKSRDGGNDVI